jgi:hypothetical protein
MRCRLVGGIFAFGEIIGDFGEKIIRFGEIKLFLAKSTAKSAK